MTPETRAAVDAARQACRNAAPQPLPWSRERARWSPDARWQPRRGAPDWAWANGQIPIKAAGDSMLNEQEPGWNLGWPEQDPEPYPEDWPLERAA